MYRRIDNAMAATGDPAYPVGVEYAPLKFRIKTRLAGQSPVFHAGAGGSMIRWTPLGTNNVEGEPYGENGWLYPGAWNGADLRVVMGGHIMRKEVVLHAGHPASFAFRLDEHQNLNQETLESPDFRVLQPTLERDGEVVALEWTKAIQGGKLILTVDLPPGDWNGWTLDPTLILQPDGADGIDTRIVNIAPTTNFATGLFLPIGDTLVGRQDRFLIKFDLSSVPSSSITSAVLSLYEYQAGDIYGLGSWQVQARRLLRDWIEIQATWNIYSTGNNWTLAGASSNGNDRLLANSSTLIMDGTAAMEFVDFSGLATDVQYFLTGNNYGWLFQAPTAENKNNTYNFFRSSDWTTASQRPKLTIEYTLGGGLLPILQQHGAYL